MTTFKNPIQIIEKLDKSKYSFSLIGKVWATQKIEIEKLIELGYEIKIHDKINDEEKFILINNCDCLIFPTHFDLI